ncbi:hypothetical protein SODALDRAFT_361526 [Sodiomyces alkalinus F11]|uniref:Uncharacterized protein n=1 Tax=Sodiomyces alkalinus (strain CBS 110278 / VKM F-3762 / F11) TaxID=1314773 RepID=A0A3N2PQC9_SODAK|nr:hypothetical protein SODALDRAFT_361526 [Sodiomyces alkalinus F11]ROT36705.1 hypothetical protein SODALDRAFT_361526 [Sodiomyces alkalinus F11]
MDSARTSEPRKGHWLLRSLGSRSPFGDPHAHRLAWIIWDLSVPGSERIADHQHHHPTRVAAPPNQSHRTKYVVNPMVDCYSASHRGFRRLAIAVFPRDPEIEDRSAGSICATCNLRIRNAEIMFLSDSQTARQPDNQTARQPDSQTTRQPADASLGSLHQIRRKCVLIAQAWGPFPVLFTSWADDFDGTIILSSITVRWPRLATEAYQLGLGFRHNKRRISMRRTGLPSIDHRFSSCQTSASREPTEESQSARETSARIVRDFQSFHGGAGHSLFILIFAPLPSKKVWTKDGCWLAKTVRHLVGSESRNTTSSPNHHQPSLSNSRVVLFPYWLPRLLRLDLRPGKTQNRPENESGSRHLHPNHNRHTNTNAQRNDNMRLVSLRVHHIVPSNGDHASSRLLVGPGSNCVPDDQRTTTQPDHHLLIRTSRVPAATVVICSGHPSNLDLKPPMAWNVFPLPPRPGDFHFVCTRLASFGPHVALLKMPNPVGHIQTPGFKAVRWARVAAAHDMQYLLNTYSHPTSNEASNSHLRQAPHTPRIFSSLRRYT